MTWERTFTVLSRYYPGITPLVIAEMTVYQVAYYLDNIGYLENQGGTASSASADVTLGMKPGRVPSTADIRALARQLNPNLNIPR